MKDYYEKSLEKILQGVNGRKIVMYGTDLLSEIIYGTLVRMGRQVSYFVDESNEKEFCGKRLKNPYELLYEDKKDIYILVFVLEHQGDIFHKLTEMGFIFMQDFSIYGLGGYIDQFDVVDSLLGFNRKYGNVLGFKVYGNAKEESTVKIMTLGGSTSDPSIGNFVSWPEYLYKKIKQEMNVVVYSGGMGGYSVHQEFFKLLRDGLILEPDIVITFDGYNDAGFQVSCEGHPFLHRYQKKFYAFIEKKRPMAPDTLDMRNVEEICHGIKREGYSDVQNWIDGIRMIHALCAEFGIKYFSFFQPMVPSGKAIIDECVVKLGNAYFNAYSRVKEVYNRIPDYVSECRKKCNDFPYITDLSDIFDGQEDVYYDICHCTEKGNQIITEYIYTKIKGAVKMKQK